MWSYCSTYELGADQNDDFKDILFRGCSFVQHVTRCIEVYVHNFTIQAVLDIYVLQHLTVLTHVSTAAI